jgi:hypothetical protein
LCYPPDKEGKKMGHCKKCNCEECSSARKEELDVARQEFEEAAYQVAFDHFKSRRRGRVPEDGNLRVKSIRIQYQWLHDKDTSDQVRTIGCKDTGGPMEWDD